MHIAYLAKPILYQIMNSKLQHVWQIIICAMFIVSNSIALTSTTTTTCTRNKSDTTVIERRGVLSQIVKETTKNTYLLNFAFMAGGASAISHPTEALAATSSSTIGDRLLADRLTLPPLSTARGAVAANELINSGIDNLYYPSWLGGTWDATQTLVQNSTPLGLKFIGGPNGSESIAIQSLNGQNKQLNVPVSLKLRYVDTKLGSGSNGSVEGMGVAEDRLFNTKQRLDAFAGRSVVSSVEYADVNGSNRSSVLAMGGDVNTPLQTTVVRFKGPAAQKSFLIGHKAETINDNTFVAYEVVRSIFALTNTNTAPPVTTDTELVWSFTKVDDEHINAKLRIASYLNAQSDKLYFEAKNQAVSLADYELKLTRAV